MAPGLLKYEGLRRRYREERLKDAELEQFYKATCEDLERLRLTIIRYLQSFSMIKVNENYVLD